MKPNFRIINLVNDIMFGTDNIDEVIHYILTHEDTESYLILKQDNHGHRIIKIEGTSYDAIEMCLLESIL